MKFELKKEVAEYLLQLMAERPLKEAMVPFGELKKQYDSQLDESGNVKSIDDYKDKLKGQ